MPGRQGGHLEVGRVHGDIAVRLAKEEDVPMHSANLLEQVLAFAVKQGGGDWDHTALIRMLEEWTGVTVRGKNAKD